MGSEFFRSYSRVFSRVAFARFIDENRVAVERARPVLLESRKSLPYRISELRAPSLGGCATFAQV